MEYEAFLICSYFAAGAICAVIGTSVYVSLRAPMRAILAHPPSIQLREMLIKAFPVTTILVALSAFMGVHYYGCNYEIYHTIASDRAYMIERNREQLKAALTRTDWVLWIWVVIVTIVVIAVRIRRSSPFTPGAGVD